MQLRCPECGSDVTDVPLKTATIETGMATRQAPTGSIGEWIGGLCILAIVVTICLLVLHWAGVL